MNPGRTYESAVALMNRPGLRISSVSETYSIALKPNRRMSQSWIRSRYRRNVALLLIIEDIISHNRVHVQRPGAE